MKEQNWTKRMEAGKQNMNQGRYGSVKEEKEKHNSVIHGWTVAAKYV